MCNEFLGYPYRVHVWRSRRRCCFDLCYWLLSNVCDGGTAHRRAGQISEMRAAMSASPQMIQAAAAGDEQALLHLLAICQPDLRRYARRTCATEDIEEAVQDALFILYRRLGTLRAIATFSGWLFQIVKRECLRRLQPRGLLSLDEKTAAGLQEPTDNGLRLDLARAITALPEIYRDVVILRDVKGLSAEETGNEIRAPGPGVERKVHRGRYLIRQQLR